MPKELEMRKRQPARDSSMLLNFGLAYGPKRAPLTDIPPAARNGWYYDDCPTHGRTSFNTIIEGCEACAREREGQKK